MKITILMIIFAMLASTEAKNRFTPELIRRLRDQIKRGNYKRRINRTKALVN